MNRLKYGIRGPVINVTNIQPKPAETKKFDLESILKILGLFATALSLFFTFLALRDTQTWKVAEFTAAQFKEFSNLPNVQLVNTLLDYNRRTVAVLSKDQLSDINDNVLFEALATNKPNGSVSSFSPVEAKLRDAFDQYFDELSLFNKYLDAHLIDQKQIEPYLKYQIDILANKNNTSKTDLLRQRIWAYIRYYNFNDVLALFKKFGYDI